MAPNAKPDLRQKLEQVNEQHSDQLEQTQADWKEFDQAREQFAGAGNDANRTDSDEFKRMEEIHKRYAESSEGLKEIEQVRDGIFRMLGNQAPQSEKWSEHLEDAPESTEGKSLGERAVGSEEYKALAESGALSSDRQPFNSNLAKSTREEFKTLLTGTSDTSGGAFITNERKPYVPQPRRITRVLDLVTVGATNSDVVEYARQTAFTNVAAETAESTDTSTGTKPEATIAFEKVTAAVKNIAHWIPATRRALADVAQLRTLIDSQLRYGLEFRLETQVVNGAGTGEDLTGILNTSNILTQAKGSLSVADAIHKAITQLRLGFVEPNGIALHPTDWELVRLSRDDAGSVAGSGAYLYGPPANAGTETIWGLPVAVSPAVPDDTGIVADFRYATLWLREGVQVLASDSHSDFFIKNLIAVLAEMRAAFGVQLPAAVCKVTGLD